MGKTPPPPPAYYRKIPLVPQCPPPPKYTSEQKKDSVVRKDSGDIVSPFVFGWMIFSLFGGNEQ